MAPEEIKLKAATLAELFAAVAAGKTLQHRWEYGEAKGWNDAEGFPCMDSDLSYWRVKPEPRRMWKYNQYDTDDPRIAQGWREGGYTVTERQEVLP